MGEIVTFYSYIGGSGQSMALANVGTILTRWGYRTLLIDWNLESPGGVERFFKGSIRTGKIPPKEGVLDLLWSAQQAVEERPQDSIFDTINDNSSYGTVVAVSLPWRELVVPLDLNFGDRLTADGKLDLLSAGRWGHLNYFKKLHTIDVHRFYAAGGAHYIEHLRHEWKDSYDFVLVDCRSGITPFGSICTVQLADILVLLLQCDDRDLVCGKSVADQIASVRHELPFDRMELLTMPIPARFDQERHPVPLAYEQHWLARFETVLTDFYKPWLPKHLTRNILSETLIPISHDDDELPSLRQRRPTPTAIATAYENIAALIANDFQRATRLYSHREGYINQAWKNVSITRILNLHKRWLANPEDGEQANLSGRDCRALSLVGAGLSKAIFANANLSSINLSGATVVKANFAGANLEKANLKGIIGGGAIFRKADLRNASLVDADLRGADLYSANLSKADFKNAKLYRATLAEATLEDVTNLTLDQLRGVNLAGATLPKELYEFNDLEEVLSESRRARLLFFILFGFCVYSVFVLYNMTDLALFTNDSVGYIDAGIPAMWFVCVIPLLLLVSHIFFLRLIQQVWTRLVNFPAIFPNGETLNEKVSNWFTAAVAYPNLAGKEGLIPKWQRLPLSLLTRFLVPVTQVFFWWKTLSLQNIRLSLFQCILVALTIALAWSYQRLGRITLQSNNTGEHWLHYEVDQAEFIKIAA